MNKENSELTTKIFDLEYRIKLAYEEQITKLENEGEHTLRRNETLQNMVHELEKQLRKEKEMQEQLIRTFEEQDKEKEDIISTLEKKIKYLQCQTKCEKTCETVKSPTANKILKSTETQTCSNEQHTTSTNSYLLTQLTELRMRQDRIEMFLENPQNIIQHRPGIPTENGTSAVLQHSTADANFGRTKQNKDKTTPRKNNTKRKTDNKTNTFSVSLQVAKCKSTQKPPSTEIYTPQKQNENDSLNQDKPNRNKCHVTTSTPTTATTTTQDTLLLSAQTESQSDLPLSDDEDLDVTETRSPARKHVRSSSVNPSSGRISNLSTEDLKRLESLKPYSFPPEETPLVTTQLWTDEDLKNSCSICFYNTDEKGCQTSLTTQETTIVERRLRNKNTSFNNFITTQGSNGKIKIIICFSANLNNWKRKLFRFLELANECIKFPVLFSITPEEIMKAVNLSNLSIRELLQVLLQFSCNAYLHRIRFYTQGKKLKETIDDILEGTANKSQRRIARVTIRDSAIYSTWRTTRGSLPSPNIYNPTRLSGSDRLSYIQGAMNEQKELWKSKETYILKELSNIYSRYNVSHLTEPYELDDFHKKTKNKAAIIDINTGTLLTPDETQRQYQFGYDGARLVELQRNENQKYSLSPNNISINNNILVSDQTQLLNDLRLYKCIKNLDITKVPDIRLNLVQGVPGCGKTTFILKNYKPGDLILFPTRDSALDFRKRFRDTHRHSCKATTKDTFRTLHSFLINSTQHIQQGNQYDRLIIDEALMMHAGEILFAAVLSGAKEVLLIGDTNQIPYINRTTAFEVKFHKISEIATTIKVLATSYRCTRTTTALLSKYYPQGMKTTNNTENELTVLNFEGLENLKLPKDEYLVLTFKQSEKRELIKLGYKTSTIHEFQGKQANKIAVIRTSNSPDEIYDSLPHCLVAISRHKKSFLYLTPCMNDTIGKWIKQANTLDRNELSSFAMDKPTMDHLIQENTTDTIARVNNTEPTLKTRAKPHSNSTAEAKTQCRKLPPMHAKLKPDNQSLDEFFAMHIQYYLQIMAKTQENHAATKIVTQTTSPSTDALPQTLPETDDTVLTTCKYNLPSLPPSPQEPGQQILVQADIHHSNSFLDHTNLENRNINDKNISQCSEPSSNETNYFLGNTLQTKTPT